MSETAQPAFLKFLEEGAARGGFETDDALAALLPLMKQTLAAHQAELYGALQHAYDDLRQTQHNPGIGHHRIGPTLVSRFLQEIKIL